MSYLRQTKKIQYHICDKLKLCALCIWKNGTITIHIIFKNLQHEYKENITRTTFPNNYRFIIFVRNPYSRIYSAYYDLKRRNLDLFKNITFKEFICKDYISKSFRYRQVKKMIYKNFLIDDGEFAPQKTFLKHIPDHAELYRFEEYESNLRKILSDYNLENIKIPHENKNYYKKNYKDSYTNLTKTIIKNQYKWDIKNLNYTFDSYGELPTIKELKNTLLKDIK